RYSAAGILPLLHQLTKNFGSVFPIFGLCKTLSFFYQFHFEVQVLQHFFFVLLMVGTLALKEFISCFFQPAPQFIISFLIEKAYFFPLFCNIAKYVGCFFPALTCYYFLCLLYQFQLCLVIIFSKCLYRLFLSALAYHLLLPILFPAL